MECVDLRVLQARTARHDQDSLESIEESVNLWRGNWGVSKSVTDLDWGEHGQPVTAALIPRL